MKPKTQSGYSLGRRPHWTLWGLCVSNIPRNGLLSCRPNTATQNKVNASNLNWTESWECYTGSGFLNSFTPACMVWFFISWCKTDFFFFGVGGGKMPQVKILINTTIKNEKFTKNSYLIFSIIMRETNTNNVQPNLQRQNTYFAIKRSHFSIQFRKWISHTLTSSATFLIVSCPKSSLPTWKRWKGKKP